MTKGYGPVTVQNISNFGFLKELQISPITMAAQSSTGQTEVVGLKIATFIMYFFVFYVFCKPVYARVIKWSDHPVKQTCKV